LVEQVTVNHWVTGSSPVRGAIFSSLQGKLTMLKHWKPLQPGDSVSIIAPASKSAKDYLNKAQLLLEDWGLKPIISPSIFGSHPLSTSFANSDEARFEHLQEALFNPDIKAIWCLRGGYGSIRLIPFLDKLKTLPSIKLFIGFSDITLLHIYFQQMWRWCTVHGPAVTQALDQRITQEDSDILRQMILGEVSKIQINNLVPLNDNALVKKQLTSSIIGGNLTLITRSIGTPFAIHIKNKILLIEEVNESFRKLDGMLMQLKLAGYFQAENKPAAILLGDFNFTNEELAEKKEVELCLQAWAKEWNDADIPVLRRTGIGHAIGNCPIPLGSATRLELGNNPKITSFLL
jgi:muramoyltetrapeptide carboxypeptidase